jgi:hypothetical protein
MSEQGEQASGPGEDRPVAEGQGEAKAGQPEGAPAEGAIKPSSPGETGTTPGTNWDGSKV